QVERKYTKDTILQMYLNENPYGVTAWGVEAASEMYFGKPISEVNLPESAILAGLPQSPSAYSPYAGEKYVGRAQEVLRRMREDGYITKDQEKEASESLSDVPIATQSGLLKAPHFVFYVRQKLIESYGEKIVETGGLRVTTTLDLDLHELAQKTVTDEINKVKYLKITNGAVIVIDPKTGQLLSMVGSRGWEDPDYDGKYNVTTALRQPGSTIKPVTYLAGLRKGYTASTMLMDTKTSFPGGDKPEYVPENYDLKFRGPVTVRDALGNSLNIPAVKILSMVGIKNMLQTAYDLGLTTLEPTDALMKRVGLSVTLGGGEVRLVELASAYSAFANGGTRVEPISILKVTDSTGKVLEEYKPSIGRQVLTPQEAFIISSILSDQTARSITFGPLVSINIVDRQVAVKTGTTNDKRDNWTIGWTPSVLVGVWVGNNDNSIMTGVASGITGAAPIWRKIIMAAYKNQPKEEFVKPEGMIEIDVDKHSGYPAHDGFDSRKESFVSGTEPVGEDPIHKKIKVCKGEGKLATVADVAGNNYDEREAWYFSEQDPFLAQNKGINKWQEGIDSWLKEQADPKYHPPTDYCGSTNSVWITIQSPGDKARINSSDVYVKVDVTDVNKITKVELFLDGELKQTFSDRPWEITLTGVADGKHKIDIRAENEKGNVGTRFVEFAVNQDF
ncbi:MAG: penicillin-binding transpeptidase domain-containing protein, partial [Patescibacteria group bacterium]